MLGGRGPRTGASVQPKAAESQRRPVPTRPESPLRAGFSTWGPVRRLLLDHLIGAQQNRWGYGKAKRLGGLPSGRSCRRPREASGVGEVTWVPRCNGPCCFQQASCSASVRLCRSGR
jgi:hypothetical protein